MYLIILAGSLIVVAVFLLVTGLLYKNLGIVITTVFGVSVLCLLALPVKKISVGELDGKSGSEFNRGSSDAAVDLPPIIHLILDEHIGIAGLPNEIKGAEELRRNLNHFYEDFGFRVFGQTYSQYALTKLALATMLRGEPNQYILTQHDRRKAENNLWDNTWFRQLSRRGYRIRIYQSSAVNFCGEVPGDVHSCYVYPSNSISSLKESGLSTITLAKAIAASFLDTLVVYHTWNVSSRKFVQLEAILPRWPQQEYKYSAPGSIPVFNRILQDIQREPRGSAFFAHLLIPHHTYMYDNKCLIRQNLESWVNNINANMDTSAGILNTPKSRSFYYGKYFEQLRCTRVLLQKFFERLQEIDAYEDATIIVHGDHGSRIALAASNGSSSHLLNENDLVDLYSVLFAVRAPGINSGYDASLRSLQALFTELVLQQALPEDPRDVVLKSFVESDGVYENGPWLRRAMPHFQRARSKFPLASDQRRRASN
jgi:hypothetical protein